MQSHFLKALSEKSYQDRWNDLPHGTLKIKRKFIQFEWCKYGDQFQIGISFCIQKQFEEYPEYNPTHAHIFIDLGFKCLEISFMDIKYNG